MKIAITGGSGLVGSRIIELLNDKYDFVNIDRANGYDILKPTSLVQIENDPSINVVLHLAAYTNVDGAEDDKHLGEESAAWKLNVTGTQGVVEMCRKTSKKFVYVSTEFVFDGAKGDYTEEDAPNPINWYGKTKYEGEKIVQNSGLTCIIARLSSPYRSAFETKKDFMRAIKGRLETGQEIKGVIDHIFTPTFIDDFAYAIDLLITKNAEGIYHLVGSSSLSPFDAAIKIAEEFNLDKNLIKKTMKKEYFSGKAERGLNWSVKNDKIKALGAEMSTFIEGLKTVKNQIS